MGHAWCRLSCAHCFDVRACSHVDPFEQHPAPSLRPVSPGPGSCSVGSLRARCAGRDIGGRIGRSIRQCRSGYVTSRIAASNGKRSDRQDPEPRLHGPILQGRGPPSGRSEIDECWMTWERDDRVIDPGW